MDFYMSSLRALQGVKRSETVIDNEVLYSEWRPVNSCLCIIVLLDSIGEHYEIVVKSLKQACNGQRCRIYACE
jgi:hypothetical protein